MPSPLPSAAPASSIDARAIAEHTFGTHRRGFAPDEVRAYLQSLADQVQALQQYIAHLEQEAPVAPAQPAPAADPPALDAHTVTRLVGEETGRVLETAREAANEIRTKAEDNAARMVRDASEEANATRVGADEYAARLRREAEEEATATRANADLYATELRRATDAEVAERKAQLAEEDDEARRAAEARAAEVHAEADAYAERVRTEADEYAAAVRTAGDEAAQRIRAGAEVEAARIQEEAAAAAAVVREDAERLFSVRSDEADAEAARIRDDAIAERDSILGEVEGVVDQARADADQLIRQAEAVRARVLHDLARRRKQSKAHLEQLEAARSRLLAAYDLVRTTADEATRELTVVLPEARAAAGDALRRAQAEAEPTDAQLEAEVAAARDLDPHLGVGEIDHGDEPHVDDDLHAGELAAIHADADAEGSGELEGGPGGHGPVAFDEGPAVIGDNAMLRDADEAERHRGGLFGRRRRDRPGVEHGVILAPAEAAPAEDVAAPAAEGPVVAMAEAPAIDDLFARLRASQDTSEPAAAPDAPTETVAPELEAPAESDAPAHDAAVESDAPAASHDDGDVVPDQVKASTEAAAAAEASADEAVDSAESEEPPEPVVAWRMERDRALAAFEQRLGRKLKRTLADEESELLDRLRTGKGRPEPDAVLVDVSEGRAGYVDASLPLLREAAAEGDANVEAIGAGPSTTGRGTTDVRALAEELAADICEHLRPRVERIIADAADGDDPPDELELADHVRAAYREWRTQRLNDVVRHVLLAAFQLGLFDGVPDGAALHWVVDDSGTPCPECADNVLGGAVVRGEPFPTDHLHPPAHQGCRCFLFASP